MLGGTRNDERRRLAAGLAPIRLVVVTAAVVAATLFSPPAVAGSDSDGDGFPDSVESFIGTDPLSACNQTAAPDDEPIDAWPPDTNNDLQVGIADAVALRVVYGSASGDGTYHPRFDLDADGEIGVEDVVRIRNHYGETCEPEGAAGSEWAFQETFDGAPSAPSQSLLSRAFDYTVTHRIHYSSPDGDDDQGSFGSFPADHGNDCVGPPNQHTVPATTHRSNSTNPDPSFFQCANHMMSSMGEASGYSVSSFWPRQEFDFSDGGVLEFDVNINGNPGRMWWEVLIVGRENMKVAAARDWLPADELYPNNSIVLHFGEKTHREIRVHADDAPSTYAKDGECCSFKDRNPNDPALVDRRIRRTNRVELSDEQISWSIAKEDGSFDTHTLDLPSGGLPFDRGLVLFKTHAYTPQKAGNDNIYTFHWDNIRFSGPALTPYEVFESPEVIGRLNSVGSTATQTINLPRVGSDTVLFGQAHEGIVGQVLLSVNGGPDHLVVPQGEESSCRWGGFASFALPIDPDELVVGANTFDWKVGPRPSCANGEWYRNGFSIKGFEVQMDSESGPQVAGLNSWVSTAATRSYTCSVDSGQSAGAAAIGAPAIDRRTRT